MAILAKFVDRILIPPTAAHVEMLPNIIRANRNEANESNKIHVRKHLECVEKFDSAYFTDAVRAFVVELKKIYNAPEYEAKERQETENNRCGKGIPASFIVAYGYRPQSVDRWKNNTESGGGEVSNKYFVYGSTRKIRNIWSGFVPEICDPPVNM